MHVTKRTSLLVALATTILLAAPGVAAAKAKGARRPASASAGPKPAQATPPVEAAPPPAPVVHLPPAPPPAPGRIEFGPAGAGMGTVVVKGASVEVTFDGRSFGAAPVTIYNVPKGDYIVEGTTADGKEVSRPVTVEENADAMVDLGAGIIGVEPAGPAEALDDSHPRLRRASHILLGVSAAALAVGLTFGMLELKAHSDYESAPADQAKLDSLAASGRRDALVANIGFAVCGAGLVAAGLAALPSFLHDEHPAATPATTAFTAPTRGGAVAGMSFRF
jgi:hypothetical protein